jgi:Predicted acetyltransferase
MNEITEIHRHGKRGSISIKSGDKHAGMMTFEFDGDAKIIIDHTEVEDEFEGKGYGKMLVAKAVEFARENNLKIEPICPYAKTVLKRNPEYHDVLQKK